MTEQINHIDVLSQDSVKTALNAIGQFATFTMGVVSDGYWLKLFDVDGGLVLEICGNVGLPIAGAAADYALPMTLSSTVGAIPLITSQDAGRIVTGYLSSTTQLNITSILHNGTYSGAAVNYAVIRINSAP